MIAFKKLLLYTFPMRFILSRSHQQFLWLLLSLIGATLLVYSNAFNGQFVFDDEFLIIKNTFIQNWPSWKTLLTSSSTMGSGGVDSFYRPLQTLFYFILHSFWGPAPQAFHTLNIGLHALNSCLFFILAVNLGWSRSVAWGASLLWLAHPLHTEAITYMSATADPLHVFFILLGLLSFSWTFSPVGTAIGGLFFILALMSKESAIIFPALALLILWQSPLKKQATTYLKTGPFWIIAGAYLVARKTFLNFDNTFEFYKEPNIYTEHFTYRLYTFFATIPEYLKLLLAPSELHFDRHFPVFTNPISNPVWIGGLIGLGLILIALGSLKKYGRSLQFGILWFIICHSPHTGVVIPVNSLFLEHWMYLPSLGLFLGVSASAWNILLYIQQNFRISKKILAPFLLGITLILFISEARLTYEQNKIWDTPISFYSNTIRYNPLGSARIYNNLAMAYDDEGRISEAIMTYRQAIQLQDTYPQTHHNLGRSLARQNQFEEAIKELETALQMNPDFYHSYATLSEIYAHLGQLDKSEEMKRKFVETRKKFFPRSH